MTTFKPKDKVFYKGTPAQVLSVSISGKRAFVKQDGANIARWVRVSSLTPKEPASPVNLVWIAEKVFDAYTSNKIGIAGTDFDAMALCQQRALYDDIALPCIDDFRQESAVLYEANKDGVEWKVYGVEMNKLTTF